MKRCPIRTRLSQVAGLAFVALWLPSSAIAQADIPRFEISGFVGSLNVTQDLGSVSTLFVDVSGEAENSDFGKHYGIRGSYALTTNLAIEGGFSQAESGYTLRANDIDAGTVDLGEQFTADHQFIGVGAVIQFPVAGGLVPYGTIGGGRYKATPSSSLGDVSEITSSDLYFGAGLKFFFSRNIGARFDFRRHSVSEGFVFEGASDEPTLLEYTIGVVIGFQPAQAQTHRFARMEERW